MYYHLRITQRSNKSHDETKLDLSEEQLRERFLQPYETGYPILINGKTIPLEDIERVRITRSKENSPRLIDLVKIEDQANPIIFLGGPSYEWEAAQKGEDVTDEFIRGPAGYKKTQIVSKVSSMSKRKTGPLTKRRRKGSSKKVFVVHGHDHALKADLEVFLHNLDLEPIVLHRQPDSGQTIIEKIEKHWDVAYAIFLMTPDDIAFPALQIQEDEEKRNYEPRARQNVIFEFGFFAGHLGRNRVCCIIKSRGRERCQEPF
jgi:hypothetical protein